MNNRELLEKDFKNLLGELNSYNEMLALAQWDMRTKIPKKGLDQRSEVVGFLAEKAHQLETSEKMKYFIDMLKEETENEIIEKAVLECEENYVRNSKIPREEYKNYVMLQSKSEAVWQEAREKADFTLFQPYLEKLVEYNQRFATYWGYKDHIYDALLHNFEPGMTTETLDRVFPDLRQAISSLVTKIKDSSLKPDSSILHSHFPKAAQEEFSKEILNRMGYDFMSGRLDETIHPFAITLNLNDVRITTRYDESDFRTAVFGTIHEGGHALYEQNISKELASTPLATGTSMGIHESQSLFWENFIGRSKAFWSSHYELFKSFAPASFQKVPLNEFYQAINEVKPSFIRIEADELTYPLHIMLRYELEKLLLNGDIKVSDLPDLWNEKMQEYLGIKPPTDREGVLQDIHWAGGDFGYFPSYALGYMYAAQFNHTLSQEVNVSETISAGNFGSIKYWLNQHIHQYGKTKKPLQLIEEVTQEKLNPVYLINYLTQKYTDIYRL
ncbi:carboxypeptidase M32 [Virgibacillus sp. SK37]|uniref:carboxypeptidase M32 n=1 Tax=Virgibacillus sp. SK37 TaxID=403957 RepID=UPI0004D0BAE4|nr:carboxypeptidase M32 [Virgibacillus sp. SK37]AIF43606.1 peptidase M32 [Virgibacillus sp. SK37]